MKFIELPLSNGEIYTVNAHHIIKMYPVAYMGNTFTRVILTTGGGMIDTPETLTEVMARIAF
jgi:alpha-L-arabinofuranosidase